MTEFFNFSTIIIICFFVYSFFGWFYESTIWAPLEKKEFLNRGFLIGPLCPIYGIVALLDYYGLCHIQNGVAIFFVASIICCLIEYLVSFSFEKLFHQRWWDYSNYPFNLHGRISLYSAIVFGIFGLLLVKIIHPFFFGLFNMIPEKVRLIISIILIALFIIDTIFSIIAHSNIFNRITTIYNQIVKITTKPIDALNNFKNNHSNSRIIRSIKFVLNKLSVINQKLINFENKFKTKKTN